MQLPFSRQFSEQSNILLVMAVVLVGLAGSYQVSRSSAATSGTNPYGAVDSCELAGGKTIIYGWGQDPNAPKGPQPLVRVKIGNTTNTAQTDISGYRDPDINAYIHKYYPGQPTPGEYGFKMTFSTLYRGNSYAISATALNYGAGQDSAIGSSSINFPGGKVPDSCLAAAPPVVNPPVVAPPTTPPPSSSPVTTPTRTTHPTTTPRTTATPAAAQTAAPASDANATVSVGTTSASLHVPVGNAAKLHISYGSDVAALNLATADQDTGGNDATVNIDGLNALSTYQYAIVRTGSDGTVVTSAPASFQTKGFTISLHYIDGKKKAVAGIQGSIDDTKKSKATSDKGGTMTFSGLPDGTYIVSYTYQNKKYTQDVDTADATATTKSDGSDQTAIPQTAVLSQTIDLSKVNARLGVGASQADSGNKLLPIMAIIGVGLLLGFVIWFWRRRRRGSKASPVTLPAPYNPRFSGQDTIDQQMTQHFETHKPAPPTAVAVQPPVKPAQPTHMGESLREMVIKSMHEEAQKKKQLPPQDPS